MLLCCSEEHKSSLESFFSAPLTFSLCCFSSVLAPSCWIFSLGSYRDFLREKEHAFMPCQPVTKDSCNAFSGFLLENCLIFTCSWFSLVTSDSLS